MILSLLALVVFGYCFIYLQESMEYKVYGIVSVVILSILYIFVVFEYYQINEESIVHVKKMGFERKEAFWKEINQIYVQPNDIFTAVEIRYGRISENSIVINAGVKNYKELVKIVLDKTKNNPKISVDIKIHKLLR